MIRMLLNRVAKPWMPFSRWLGNAPIEDSLDRRNAPFLQVVLILIIVWAPISAAIALAQSLSQPTIVYSQVLLRLADDISGIACVCGSLWLVRRGKLRAATKLFLGFLTLSMAMVYAAYGIERIPADMLPLLLLAIGGQVLGRRALWTVFAAMVASLLAAYLSEVLFIHPQAAMYAHGLVKVATIGVIYLCVALVVDQTVVALRQAIIESHERERALDKLSRTLQSEIMNHRLAQEKLMHVHKIEAVNRIAAGVAHDFGNVLGVISGYADQCESISDRGMPAMIEAMEDIGEAARTAAHLNRQLLDFSRRSTTRNEVFDLSQAARTALRLVRPTFTADVVVTLDESAVPVPVMFDRSHFDLIVLNMAANARDAMPAGGTFRIACEKQHDTALIEFRDTGMGMDATTLTRLFEPFFTTKTAGKGTGLGLTLVSELVQGAGGTVSVTSAPGDGTRFRLTLPLARPMAGLA